MRQAAEGGLEAILRRLVVKEADAARAIPHGRGVLEVREVLPETLSPPPLIPVTPPSFKIDLLKNRSPLKLDRGSNFGFWPKWAFFGPARPRE